jgi:hypothetical protein
MTIGGTMKKSTIKLLTASFLVGLGSPVFVPLFYTVFPLVKAFVVKNADALFYTNLFVIALWITFLFVCEKPRDFLLNHNRKPSRLGKKGDKLL